MQLFCAFCCLCCLLLLFFSVLSFFFAIQIFKNDLASIIIVRDEGIQSPTVPAATHFGCVNCFRQPIS